MTRLIFTIFLEVLLDLAVGNLANYAEFASQQHDRLLMFFPVSVEVVI